jgi:hypothetical protein
MAPVKLPSTSYYVSVDGLVLQTAMARIEEQFRDLLENGNQARGLPDGMYAAGQHLNPYSMNQRGLYGTAAALLVLGRSQPSPRRIALIEGLIRYISERPTLEPELLSGEEDLSDLRGRLARDEQITFKTADLLYALSAAPPAAAGRDPLLQKLLAKLAGARRPGGGWSCRLSPVADRDALATASVVRGQCAAGIPVEPVDLEFVKDDAADRKVSAYIRTFCVLVLAEVTNGGQDAVRLWRELYEMLKAELRQRAESNYEFRIGQAMQYVRVPWQLYLIAGACWCRPSSIVFAREFRAALFDCIEAVGSVEGYFYPAFGQMKSTRTYSIAMDTLDRVESSLSSYRYLARTSAAANIVIRIRYSRALSGLALAGALALAGLAVATWLSGTNQPWAALGPELVGAALLGLIGLLLRRVRRWP